MPSTYKDLKELLSLFTKAHLFKHFSLKNIFTLFFIFLTTNIHTRTKYSKTFAIKKENIDLQRNINAFRNEKS